MTGESGFLKSFLKGQREDEISTPEAEEAMDEAANTDAPETATGPVVTESGDRALEARVIDALSEIYDPEIPVNIYELGLVYDVKASADGDVHVVMTLTTPHCPVAESMPGEVEMRVRDVEGVRDVNVELVWDPPWDMTMMSEAARLELGFM